MTGLKLTNGDTMQASDSVFGRDFNEALVHQVVTAVLAGARRGTKAQKTRSQTAGGGRKPWRQKGTGRARTGTIRNPIWRGGGKAFAAVPRDFSQKINRKMYRRALSSILSELHRHDRLRVVDEIVLAEPRTRLLVEKLESWSLESVLIVDKEPAKNLTLASRNVPGVGVLPVAALDPVTMLRFNHVLLTAAAVDHLGERLQ